MKLRSIILIFGTYIFMGCSSAEKTGQTASVEPVANQKEQVQLYITILKDGKTVVDNMSFGVQDGDENTFTEQSKKSQDGYSFKYSVTQTSKDIWEVAIHYTEINKAIHKKTVSVSVVTEENKTGIVKLTTDSTVTEENKAKALKKTTKSTIQDTLEVRVTPKRI